ncbi:MAG: ComF family protein [Patescibacteria group bacterium]
MLKFLWDILFPIQCLGGCGTYDTYLCPKCSEQFKNGKSEENHYYLDEYKNPLLRNCIHQLKYGYSEELGKILGKLLADSIDLEFDYVIPVPIHKKRRKERGFNQTELLAREFDTEINLDLVKVKNTKSQMTLNKTKRLTNLNNCFKYKNNIKIENKKLLIVDDVYTTGTTVNEIKKTLFSYNPKGVWVATLAKGKD